MIFTDISEITSSMVQLWYDFFDCENPITEIIDINPEVLAGFGKDAEFSPQLKS